MAAHTFELEPPICHRGDGCPLVTPMLKLIKVIGEKLILILITRE
jgi:hypothetical protein